MIELRKYSFLGLTAIRSSFAYLGEQLFGLVFLAVILFIFLQLWRATFAGAGETKLGDLSLAQMIWYLAIAEGVVMSRPPISSEVDQDVRSGSLSVQLLRPLAYPLAKLSASFGERLVRFGLIAGTGCLLALIFVGTIPFSLEGFGLFLIVLPIALLLDTLGFLMVGLSAFWLEDTSGFTLIYSRMTMILGGMLVPLELFPDFAKPIVEWLPFSGAVYAPARLFVHPNLELFSSVIVRQGLSLLILSLIVFFVYRAGLKRIHSNGG
jgi:ABC-2 type transport system permease protein